MTLLSNWRKLVLLTALVCTFMVVTMTSASAVNPCVPRPGCSCRFYDAAERHADAIRVRNKAYTRQILKQNDNTMGMNCFDKSLVLASRQGQIFSDTSPGAFFPPANYIAFDPANKVNRTVYDPSAGVGNNPRTGQSKLMSQQYSVVFSGEAANHSSTANFADTLSYWLGATLFNLLGSFLSGINAFLTNIVTFVNNLTTQFNNYLGYINQIQNFLDILGAALPSVVLTTVALVQGVWATISSTLISAVNLIQTSLNNAINFIVSQVQGLLGSLLQFLGAPNDPCSRIKRLWNPDSVSNQSFSVASIFDLGAGIAGLFGPGFRPLEGGGIERGAPYFDFNGLLTGTFTNWGTGAALNMTAASDLTDEIANALNAPILNAALTDLQAGGLLNAPQAPAAGVIWPSIPAGIRPPSPWTPPPDAAAINAVLANIISQM